MKDHGHTVFNPAVDDDDFTLTIKTAQTEFDKHRLQVVGSSRGGAVAMNIMSGDAKLVLLCPAWKKCRDGQDRERQHGEPAQSHRRRCSFF